MMRTSPKGSFRMKAESSCVAWVGVSNEALWSHTVGTRSSQSHLPPPPPTYQILGHFLILHPRPQVPEGQVHLSLTDGNLGHLRLKG